MKRIPDAPVIMLSRETFSGAMPGYHRFPRRMIRNYAPVAVPLGKQIIAALKDRFGDDVQITFLYTLREKECWIRSVYGNLPRSIHLRSDFPTFRARFPKLIDPKAEAQAVAKALGVTDVVYAPLENYSHRNKGPAAVVLDMLGLPDSVRTGLPAATRANTGQSAAIERLS